MGIPVFDAHCDTISKLSANEGLRNNKHHLDLQRGMSFSPYAQIFAVFQRPFEIIPSDYSKDIPIDSLTSIGDELLTKLLIELYHNSDVLCLCRSVEDAKNAANSGKVAAFIAIEGAELLGCDIWRLERAYKQGVRFINLCWNYDNALCGAANASASGLTPLGRKYVQAMQELGMVVDLSHASERTFWETAEIAKRPIIAGHSNSKKICDNPRNLTDAQFKELVRQKGVAGLNLCPIFLNESGSAKIVDIIRHAEHFLELGGEKSICLGGDLDGIDTMPSEIMGIEDYCKIYEAMLCQNWSESIVRDIFYNNLFEVLERTL